MQMNPERHWTDDKTLWSEGVIGDGVAILRDGQPVAISELLSILNSFEDVVERERYQRAIANDRWYCAAKAALSGDTHALQCWVDASDGKI